MFSLLLQSVLLAAAIPAVWLFCRRFVFSSKLHRLPGPHPLSFWQGNLPQLFDIDGWAFHHDIVNKYGGAVKIHGLCGDEQVYVSDPKALYHIVVKDQDVYEETANFITTNRLCFGMGLTATLGDHHRRQRKMLNPVFNINHMRGLTPLFYRITHQLRGILTARLASSVGAGGEVDMLDWMSRTALEYIGQGGLGYTFDALEEGSKNEYSACIKKVAPLLFRLSILRQFLPLFYNLRPAWIRRVLVMLTPSKRVQALRTVIDVMHANASAVFEQKKKALEQGDEQVMCQVGEGKDIMSVLLKENMHASAADCLSDSELVGQMSTLLFAASDTTSSALARILHVLALHPDAQERLRAELRDARAQNTHARAGGREGREGQDSGSGIDGGEEAGDVPYDELVALPYLDAVCRETLRLYPPVMMLHRTTRHDIVLPLSTPLPSTTINTKSHAPEMLHSIALKANTNVIIGIQAANRSRAIWGEDAREWKPERWLQPLPESVAKAHLPGIYSSMMSFLGGSRACIGFKFSQLEMKVVLCVLITYFRFSPSDKEIFWRLSGIVSPGISTDKSGLSQLPLHVELVRDSYPGGSKHSTS